MIRKHLRTSLLPDSGSYALLSNEERPETAIIFVHGFNGDPTGTWLQVQFLIDEAPAFAPLFAACDLYFYSYDSLRGNVAVNASRLAKFVRRVYPEPDFPMAYTMSGAMREFIPSPANADKGISRSYGQLVLVGHSLGGVLIRQAIVNECLDFDNQISGRLSTTQQAPALLVSSRLRLFAPAIFGFEPVGATGFLYHFCLQNTRLKALIQPILESVPIHQDLEADSARLRRIEERTEELAQRHPDWSSLRAHMLFGIKEKFIYMERYSCDPISEFVEDQDHTSVCKPNASYLKPLEFIAYGLSASASA